MNRRIGNFSLPALLIGAMACALAACGGSGKATRNPHAGPDAAAVNESRRRAAYAENRVREGDLQTALAEFAKAISRNPNFVRARLGMADIYRMQGDWSRAERQYRMTALLQPDNPALHYYHGLMLHLENRVSEAIAAYLRAFRISQNHFETNLNLANAFYQVDELTRARAHARRAVSVKPQDGNARFTLGAIYSAEGLHEEAVTEFQQAAELMELSPKLLTHWARSLIELGRYAEAKNVLERLVREAPSPAGFERLGFVEFKQGNLDAAQQAFERALELDRDHIPAINGVAICHLNRYVKSDKTDRESHRKAIDLLRRSLQLNPDQQLIKELLFRYK